MKQIFLSIQKRLADNVPALQYIDKNWGQLNIAKPPVKWPCCLMDIDSIDYSQASENTRVAEASIILTIADCHTVRSSANAPNKEDSYAILDVIEKVAAILDGYRVPDTTQALVYTRMQKTFSDQSYDVYNLTFTTAWVEEQEKGGTVKVPPLIKVSLKLPE